MIPEPETLLLSDGALHVRVARRGAALTQAQFDGTAFLMPGGGPDGRIASFPLVPFGNRVEHNGFTLEGQDYRFLPNSSDPLYLHGDGWLADWDIEEAGCAAVSLSLRHVPEPMSPYDYSAFMTISLEANEVTLHLSVRHEGDRPQLYGLGQHPFFVRTEKTCLTARAQSVWSERDGHLPDRNGPLPEDLDFSTPGPLPRRFVNNAFAGWNGHAAIEWPELGLGADINAGPNHDIYMLYLPNNRPDFFCFEPMTHLPNAHHMPGYGGLRLLAAGDVMSSTMTIRLRRI